MAGSSESIEVFTSTPPGEGSRTGSVVNCQLSCVGRPTGRAARRIWRLLRAWVLISQPPCSPCSALRCEPPSERPGGGSWVRAPCSLGGGRLAQLVRKDDFLVQGI